MGNLQETLRPDLFKSDIKGIVSRISRIDEDELQDHLLIREELGIDSLMAMEIMATCEKHLNIKMDETLFVNVQTVGDFLTLLMKQASEKNA